MATFRFLGPNLDKVHTTGGIILTPPYKSRMHDSAGNLVVFDNLEINDERTVTDTMLVKIMTVSSSWEEVV